MEAEIKFEPTGRSGVVPVGTYLFDAAARMGVYLEAQCGRLGKCDSCAVTVTEGRDLLSETTAAEIEQLSQARRGRGERLACCAKIQTEGEILIMVAEKQPTEEEKEAERQKELRKEFEDLPLEKKVARLVELEAITLGETFSFVLNSPFKIFGKLMDVMAEFGLKLDDEAKKQQRPAEHEAAAAADAGEKTEQGKRAKKRGGKAKATETAEEAS
jgi:uncharacterized 2Fe-2S/4Fe-4S cluster protein (DUF4445 family)